MTADEWSRLCGEFLSIIEKQEVKLLTWGVVSGELTDDELADLAESFLAERPGVGVAAKEMIDALLERALLFRTSSEPAGYRSRMAEAVRLFANLRQILHGRKWQLAPTLVADYRFATREREYPKRNISPQAAFDYWRGAGVLNAPRETMLAAALGGDRSDFNLSGFQVRATSRMFLDLGDQWSRGMIVTVGTGSGKTLAFYLPALSHLATLVRSGDYWTKAVAIYPRNELLKDQFAEAHDECRRYDAQLIAQGRRKLTIGAFFSLTPWSARKEELKRMWQERGRGYACPFLRCPNCDSELLWTIQDLTAETERLQCSMPDCGGVVGPDEVMLTRNRMLATPPDVLFTTTETLNRRMSDTNCQHVFGVGAKKKPQLVLLDEVHTYVGTSGAQSALLLRRWRHAIGAPMHFCGLSATLRNASDFFMTLTGLSLSSIEVIVPAKSEMEASGMEYMLALRSDPASRVAVLSTSIQAAMLLGRVLDTRNDSVSGGLIGTKVFAFADNLDVINRFYHNLLDAEGWNGHGKAQRRVSLAASRSRTRADLAERSNAGQVWRIAEEIGHPEGLEEGLRISRTSSQDAGVDDRSQVIIATASLEVGFNDPAVGAVLQHKAPRDVASFLQRKGRAGRNRLMRPWTVIVLSDFGRDRIAYQAYEALFNPELAPRILPVANRYVLRMQAVFSFMEWVGLLVSRSEADGSVYDDFAKPATDKPWDRAKAARQQKEITLIKRLLDGEGAMLSSLRRHLHRALQIDEETVDELLWQPPRAILTSAAPTILRRLETGWQRIPLNDTETEQDPSAGKNPLPEFVPENLFSDLNLPEVRIVSPEFSDERESTLPIIRAIESLSPGSVTRRFAVREAKASHWIAPADLEGAQQEMTLSSACETFEEAGYFEMTENDKVVSVRCVRPLVMRLQKAPANVLPSSKALPEWHTQIIPVGKGVQFDMPQGSIWQHLLHQVTFYVHNRGAAVEIRRFSTGSQATVLFQSGGELRTRIRYVDAETKQTEALGFSELVDGVVFDCAIPEQLHLSADSRFGAKMRGLRTAYFQHVVRSDCELGELASYFQCERLQETYLSALAAYALSTNDSLEGAYRAFTDEVAPKAMKKVLSAVFRTLPVDWRSGEEEEPDTEDLDTDDATAHQQKAHTALLELINDREVLGVLRRLAPVLWEDPDPKFFSWVRRRLKATVGAALLAACLEVNPESGADQLILDLESGPRPDGTPKEAKDEIWITERTMGGGGVLEEVMLRFASDPRRFFRLAESALAASDFELVDSELTRILELLSADAELMDSAKMIRSAQGHGELQRAVETNMRVLEAKGIQTTHSVLSALHSRVLRPASDAESDEMLRRLMRRWHLMEEQLGVEVDARVFAYLAASEELGIDAVLRKIDPRAEGDLTEWRLRVIHGLLWPRGHTIRGQVLASYNPFSPVPEADRLLVVDVLGGSHLPIPLTNPSWREQVAAALRIQGVAKLFVELGEASALRDALLGLASTSIEVDFLQLYPQVEGVERTSSGIVATLHLPESVQ